MKPKDKCPITPLYISQVHVSLLSNPQKEHGAYHPDRQKRGTGNDLYLQAVSSLNSIVDEPCASQEKGERGDDADKSRHGLAFPFQGGLGVQFRLTTKSLRISSTGSSNLETGG